MAPDGPRGKYKAWVLGVRAATAGHAMPWLASALIHLVLIAVLSLVGLMFADGAANEEIIVPDARLSDTPGGVLRADTDRPPLPTPAEAARTQDSPLPVAEPVVEDSEVAEPPAVIVGVGGAAQAALASLGARPPEPPAGPPSRFFGTGGNAHHIVYLVDWSGSMIAQRRFEMVQLELLRSLGELQPSQSFHVIFFSQGEPLEGPPRRLTAATDEQRAAAARAMQAMPRPESPRQGGYNNTDPVPALRRAFEVLRRPPTGKPGRLIYLLTDGDFADNQAVLAEMERLNRGRDVHINAILYATALELSGGSMAAELLQTIAADHGGSYKWVNVSE